MAEWAKALPQIQAETHRRSQVQIPLGDVCNRLNDWTGPLAFKY